MGKKGITSIFSKLVDTSSGGAGVDGGGGGSPSSPWPWPSCRNPQTASFRDDDDRTCSTTAGGGAAVRRRSASPVPTAATGGTAVRLDSGGGAGEMYKTVNSVYQLDYYSADGSCFDDEEERGAVVDGDDDGFSTTTASEEWSEAVIRSLGRTSTDGRFFVDPGPASNSILAPSPGKSPPALSEEEEKKPPPLPASTTSLVEESVAVAVDSEDPYGDFRASMEEMVAAHRLRGWDALEELLLWYLRINGKHNHALIVGAFVDLLVGLATPPPSSSTAPTTTTTTNTSSSSSASTTSTSASSSTCTPRPAAAATTTEQCGGAGNGNDADASRSSASTSSDQDEAVVGDEPGDDDHHIAVALHTS